MGHLFRALNLAAELRAQGFGVMVLVNRHEPSERRLSQAGIDFEVVDLGDFSSNWEAKVISKYKIDVWVNDRLNTDERHANHVKRQNIALATFDDRGGGASLADLNVAALQFDASEALSGLRVLRGVEYLVLNRDIEKYQRIRYTARRILVTMGGSDTWGVTPRVVKILRKSERDATVILGPDFRHQRELDTVIGPTFKVERDVASLIAEFAQFDLAITAGGITPFEANASGLPCVVIAAEFFEIPLAQELARLGGSVFAGHHSQLQEAVLSRDLPVEAMSRAGIAGIGLKGASRVVSELMSL